MKKKKNRAIRLLAALVLAVLHGACGSLNVNLPDIAHSDPDAPPETVPMTARLSDYRSMSIRVAGADGVSPALLPRLREMLVWRARSVKGVPAIVEDAAAPALELRVTLQRLEQGADAVVVFELVEVARQRLLTSFTITSSQGDRAFEKPHDPAFADVAYQFKGWLLSRASTD